MSVKDKLDYLQDTKQAIKTAIQGKGQAVSDADTFRSYADKINAITTGGGGSDEATKELIECTITSFDDTAGSISKIGAYAFYLKQLTSVNFPACTSIGNYAFANCYSLQSVNFPRCTSIRYSAFANCYSLQSVNFPACTSIGDYAFINCSSLQTISFPVCTSIGNYAFANCYSLQTINFPRCISIFNYAFASCYSLQSVDFSLCSYIGANVFVSCRALTSVNFPNCTSIMSGAFSGCTALTSLDFLNNVKSVGNGAFLGTGITELYLPNLPVGFSGRTLPYNVQIVNLPICRGGTSYAFVTSVATEFSLPACITLASYAFQSASQLQTLSLPNCTWFRSYSIFASCKALSTLYLGRKCVLDNTNTFISTPFSNSTYLGYFGSVYVRQRDLSWYQTATNWVAYSSRITTYEPEEDLLDEVDNFIASGRSLTTTIENCQVGDNLVASVLSSSAQTISDGWTLISSQENLVASSATYKLYVYTKVATSTTESITTTQTSSGRLYTGIVNIKSKTPNLVSELNNTYNASDYAEITITKPNSNEMLIFAGAGGSPAYTSCYALKGEFNNEYVIGQQGRLIMIHTTKPEGTEMEFRYLPSGTNSLGIIGIELV